MGKKGCSYNILLYKIFQCDASCFNEILIKNIQGGKVKSTKIIFGSKLSDFRPKNEKILG